MATPLAIDRARVLNDPGFVPGALHLAELFAWLAEANADDAVRIERVIARAGERALSFALSAFPTSHGERRARLLGVLGRLGDARAAAPLRESLLDPEPRVRRRAAGSLGRLPAAPENEAALVAALENAAAPEQRAIVEALGKVGGFVAKERLAALPRSDAELSRRLTKPQLLIDRRLSRDRDSHIAIDRRLGATSRVLLRCRSGLARYLSAELSPLGTPRVLSEGVVELDFDGALEELFVARTALEWGIQLPLSPHPREDLPMAVADALAGAEATRVLAAWTHGETRFRLEFAEGGHQRARVFELADVLAKRLPALVNDPRQASWTFVVVSDAEEPHLVLVPSAYEDPRFAYRRRDVRAASHPTIAAALARAAGVRADDRVWDPFVGSGLELVERARLGPYAALFGSDRDPEALDAARENLAAAGVRADLRVSDATAFVPERTSLILTNPPMGRRLLRDRTLGGLLDRFVLHAGNALEPGGRLVWLSPLPRETRERARSAKLELGSGHAVDMGGFDAELQIFRKPTKHPPRP